MKIAKALREKHRQAKDLLKKSVLTHEEKLFVLEHFHEGCDNLNGLVGAFFTPMELAYEFSLLIYGKKVVDLCAGIGVLSFAYLHNYTFDFVPELTCIEINPEFVEIGKKLLPEANWICGDITNPKFIASLPEFDFAIGNPPFGMIKTGLNSHLKYRGTQFEYKVIEVAHNLAADGVFIIPQESAPFLFSGEKNYVNTANFNSRYQKFEEQTGIELACSSVAIDTSRHLNKWKGVRPKTEVVTFEILGKPVNRFKYLVHQKELFEG